MLVGSQEGLAHALLACTDPGDTILMPDLAYASYFGAVKIAGLETITVPFKRIEGRFLPDLSCVDDATLLKAKRAKVLLLNFPNNPTSATADEAYFLKAIDFCKRHKLLLIHDNPYIDQTYDEDHAISPLSLPGGKDVCIELFSISKSYHLAGFRCGFALGSKDAIKALEDVKSPIDFNQWVGVQRMAMTCFALPRERVRADALIWKARAKCMTDELRDRCQWIFQMPDSCMYLFGSLPEGFSDDLAFCLELLRRTGVAISPGRAFGPGGVGCVRFALVQREERLVEAAERIKKALGEMKVERREG
jgi:aspartate/methionine/tyrosine aminotransferase